MKSPHVRYADEAYHVGGALSADSYLRVERLLEVARESNVDAIHPGYGFLSENASLCSGGTRCWVNLDWSKSRAITVMGSKTASRQKMVVAGVPVVPELPHPSQLLKKH